MTASNAAQPACFDVAIVGAGPTGVALANLLGRQGVTVALIDRNAGILQLPRAVHFDGETMRIFQNMGLHAQVLAISRPGQGMRWVDQHGETLLQRTGVEGLGSQGWHNDYYFHQPVLEQTLRDGLRRFAQVHLLENAEAVACAPDAGGVELTLQAPGNPASQRTIRAGYVVGCDGARSIVRGWIGEEHEDLGEHQAWLVVDAVLHHPLRLPEQTVQHCDPRRPATSNYVHPLRRRWEIMLLPGDDPQAMTEPEQVWKLLSRWVRPTQATLERAATYTFHSLVARHWSRGRLFIAGDAAHQTPPFLGQGLCAGIRDAMNLAWKLPLALRHPAAAARLLATYGSERLPHAREFVQLAVEVGKIIQVLDPAQAAERDARLKSQGLQFAFPEPRLGDGVHRAGHEAGGRIHAQPLLSDGRWLDDVARMRFAVLLAPQARATLPAGLGEEHIVLVTDPGSDTRDWLRRHDALAVILRPDGYVFDVCASSRELDASLAALAQWIAG